MIILVLFIAFIKSGKISITGDLKHYLHAKKRVKQASKLDELPEILKTYLETKMKTQIGLSSIEDVCKKLKLTDSTATKLTGLWNHIAMLKYAPAIDANSKDVLGEEKAKLISLLSYLEKEIK